MSPLREAPNNYLKLLCPHYSLSFIVLACVFLLIAFMAVIPVIILLLCLMSVLY
jgi:hypothetical protein